MANHNNWSRWFAISSLSPVCSPNFSCMAEDGIKKKTKLGCEKIFIARSHTKHPWSWLRGDSRAQYGNLHNKLDE